MSQKIRSRLVVPAVKNDDVLVIVIGVVGPKRRSETTGSRTVASFGLLFCYAKLLCVSLGCGRSFVFAAACSCPITHSSKRHLVIFILEGFVVLVLFVFVILLIVLVEV